MSSRKVTDGEEKYVEKALEEFGGVGTDDRSVWMDWVLKKKREKIQDRLLVVSRYRILSIKRNKVGKKTTQRQGHLYSLRKVAVDNDFNRCVLKFPDFHIEFSSPKIQEVIDAIRTSYQKISYDFPESEFFQINAPEGSIKDLEERDVTPTEGTLDVYNSYCNYYAQPPSPDFKRFVEDTFATDTLEFNISKCPGIEPKTEYTFDLRPALSIFAHCKRFRSFKLQNVQRREAVGVFAGAVNFNQTITRIVLSGLDAGPEGFISLGDAFKKNPGNKVCELDLSDNKMGERGIAGLSSGLMTIQHGLTRFNVGKNGITPKGITSLISSLRANSQVSGTLIELDLSENKFEAMASQAFADWVTDLKECATIETLNLSDTAIDVPTVLTGIRLGLMDSITNLNLSNNRIDKMGAQAIGLLLETSPHLQYLNLSYCKLAPEGIELMLVAIKGNGSMSELKVDFSGNELGVSGADKVANGLEGNEKVHTLILQDNGLKVEGMKKILATLMENSSLRCLDLSSNLRGSTNTKALTEGLCSFLKKHSSIETLLLTGDGKAAYGKEIVELFNALNDCPTLTELDVSNNKFGDRAATEISESLRKNTTLTYMAWDNNGVNIGGYQAFRSCLTTSNKTLLEVPHPRMDVEKAVSTSKDPAKFRERITELFNEVNAALKANKEAHTRGDSDTPLKTNIFSRQKEEYKEPPEVPPVSASPTTQSARIATLRRQDAPSSRDLNDSNNGSTIRKSAKKDTSTSKGKKKSNKKDKKQKQEEENEAKDSPRTPRTPKSSAGGDSEEEEKSERDTNSEDYDTTTTTTDTTYTTSEKKQEEKRFAAPPPMALPPALYQSDGVNTFKSPPVFSASTNGKSNTVRGSGGGAPPVFSPPPGRGRGSGLVGSQTLHSKPPSFTVPPATPPPVVEVPPPEIFSETPLDEGEEPPPPPPPRDDLEDEELYNYG